MRPEKNATTTIEYYSLERVDFLGSNNYEVYETFKELTELVKDKI